MRLFFTDSHKKQTTERKLWLVQAMLSEIADENAQGEPIMRRNLRDLVKNVWLKTHHIQPVVKVLYEVARGSRHERRRRRAYMRSLRLQKNI